MPTHHINRTLSCLARVQGLAKHPIPGFDVGRLCNPGGRRHIDGFEEKYPCQNRSDRPTQAELRACLPDTTSKCAELMPSRDPAVTR